jgi:tetratricopeptide (TPR) repeat protein
LVLTKKPAEEEIVTVSENTITLSPQVYGKRLLAHKNKLSPALTAAMEQQEEAKREKLQLAVVSLTEALTYFRQSYQQEISCRKAALAALSKIQSMIDKKDLAAACKSLQSEVSTQGAEQIFDKVLAKGGKAGAFAAFHGGRLAECRMDFSRAAAHFDKALELDRSNIHYLKAAGLLARKMYEHKKALACFAAIEKLLAPKEKESAELAIARRELAYTALLLGQHKQAGEYYKKAMQGLTSLLGKTHPEVGICWFQLGLLQESQGLYEKADGPYKQALSIMEKTTHDSIMAEILDKLARLHMELEGEAEALPLFERLLAIKRKSPQPDLAGLIIIFNNLAEASRICGQYERSEGYYKQALQATQKLRGKDHPAVGSIYQELAKLCERQRKMDEAKHYKELAAALFQQVIEQQGTQEGDSEERLTL